MLTPNLRARCGIDGATPLCFFAGLGIGVDRHEHMPALGLGVADAFAGRGEVEVQAGEIACVGGVLEAHVHRVGAMVHGRLQRRQAACRTNQFWLLHWGGCAAVGGRIGRVITGSEA